jgi:sulfate/thiosulfate transport system permease protein
MSPRIGLYSFVYLWFAILLALPLAGIVGGAFSSGLDGFVAQMTKPEAVFSLQMTFVVTAVVVVVNAVFGLLTALLIARRAMPGWTFINAVVDLPFAVSPVIAGLALVLVYGPNTLIGGFLLRHGVKIIFAIPGMILATLFITFPFVVRELVPVLRELGTSQEEAACTLGASRWRTFWTVTLPGIRWSLVYGIVLTIARSLGEFGAVLVVSGNVIMLTQTATTYVYQATVDNDMQAAYAVSVVLGATSMMLLLVLQFAKKRQEGKRA